MKQLVTKALFVATLLDTARSQLGVRETQDANGTWTNSGTQIEKYQAATTLGGTGWPYCAGFDAWCIQETGKKLDIDVPWSNSASCDVVLADGQSRGLLRDRPEPGDVFLVMALLRSGSYSEHDATHTGIVEVVNNDGTWKEISGNTNADGGREGIGVMRTSRKLSKRYKFLRIVDGIDFPEAEPAKPWKVEVKIAKGSSGAVFRTLTPRMENGTAYVAVRDWAEMLGKTLTQDPGLQTFRLGSVEVPGQPRKWDGHNYYSVRVLAGMSLGSNVQSNAATQVVQVFLP